MDGKTLKQSSYSAFKGPSFLINSTRKNMKEKSLKRFSYSVLVGPSLLIYSAVIIFPLIYSFTLSFTQWSGFGSPNFIGFENYIKMFNDKVFYIGLKNNFLIVLVSVFGQIPLGFTLAFILYRKQVRGVQLFEALLFFPTVISAVVIAILFGAIFSPTGVYTMFLREVLNDPRYIMTIFQNKQLAIVPILFVILWAYTGLYMIIYLANLQKIPDSVIEAAIIDGASEFQILLKIILPSMVGILFTTSIFAITGSLKSFDLVFAMTGGGPAHFTEVVAIYMVEQTFKYYKYGFGSSISMVVVLLSVGLIILLQTIYARYEKKYQ